LLEESKQSIKNYAEQCWWWKRWRWLNRNGLNYLVMLGWWRGVWWCWGGGEGVLIAFVWCTTYFACDIWIERKVLMCEIWRNSLLMCVFLK
jgi:hypothetical protein